MSRRLATVVAGTWLLVLAGVSAAEPEERSHWKHNEGYFEKTKGDQWLEKYGNDTFQYVETDRTDKYVELFDKSRNLYARLFADHYENKFNNKWQRIKDGGWVARAATDAKSDTPARLVFQGEQGCSICDLDGKNGVLLMLPVPKRFKDNYFGPISSPDGKRIAFYGSTEKAAGFFVMDADGSNVKKLTSDPDSYHAHLSWFPDGKHLICQEFDASTGTVIWLLNPDGSNPTPLTENNLECVCPSISPDGKKIALVQGQDKNRAVCVMDADGKNLKRLHKLQNKPYAGDVAWSPDGKRLLYNNAGDLYVMNPDGSDNQQVTRLGDISYPAWSPDGKVIAFLRPEGGESFKHVVYLVNADGSNPRAVVKGLPPYAPGWWTPTK